MGNCINIAIMCLKNQYEQLAVSCIKLNLNLTDFKKLWTILKEKYNTFSK